MNCFLLAMPSFACQQLNKCNRHTSRKLSKMDKLSGPDLSFRQKQGLWEQLEVKNLKAACNSQCESTICTQSIAPVTAILLSVLLLANVAHAALQPKADTMQCAKVIEGPLAGKTARIEGTTQEMWGIDDIWTSPSSFSIRAISKYLLQNPPMGGTVYYGKVDGLGNCFHQSWLQSINAEDCDKAMQEQEELICEGNVCGPRSFVKMMNSKPAEEK